MVGRPRKIGKRERNGRGARVYENPKAFVAKQPHRRDLPAGWRDRPEAGSEFGRTMIRKQITPAQYEAGCRYAAIVDSYRALIGAPAASPPGIEMDRVGPSQGREMPIHIARRIRRSYDEAFEAMAGDGQKAQRAVAHHAVNDRPISDFESLGYLRRGLSTLVEHFGIDRNLQIVFRQKCKVE